MPSGENLRCRKVEHILQYHILNQHKDLERYVHYLIFIFYSFHNNSEWRKRNPSSHRTKFKQPGVINIVHQNKALIEPFSELADASIYRIQIGISS